MMWRSIAITLGLVLVVCAIVVWKAPVKDRENGEAPSASNPEPDTLERGRALVVLGNCRACHTGRGGAAFAGGRAIPTQFGTFYSPNITMDPETGIGRWSAEDFWRSVHNGIAPDGSMLYPVFPYTSYTQMSRADVDAMFAYLKTIPPVNQARREHELAFPYGMRFLLAAWRRMYFTPGVFSGDPSRSTEWNRGAYLVRGVAHCEACHLERNALGATRLDGTATGGSNLGWYAPALSEASEAGVQQWDDAAIVSLLKSGRTSAGDRHASTMGPMAEVVYESLQHVAPGELQAMATYLRSIPAAATTQVQKRLVFPSSEVARLLETGGKLYTDHCAQCHGDNGEGRVPAAPALAGNRAVTMSSAANPIRIVLYGGYPPGTIDNPRPFGMPPYSHQLNDRELSAVLSYVRLSWGNNADLVTSNEVARSRSGPLW
jgi:mono/diheme cytochrome c family protein